MDILIFSLLIVLITFLISNTIIRNQRLQLKNDLRILYSQLEFQIIKEHLVLNNQTLKFLSIYKFTSEMTDMLDVQILWCIHKMAGNRRVHATRDEFNTVRNSLSPETLAILNDFNLVSRKMIALSFLKPDLILWLFGQLLKDFWKSIVKLSLRPLIKSYNFLNEVKREMQEIISVGKDSAFGNNGNYNIA